MALARRAGLDRHPSGDPADPICGDRRSLTTAAAARLDAANAAPADRGAVRPGVPGAGARGARRPVGVRGGARCRSAGRHRARRPRGARRPGGGAHLVDRDPRPGPSRGGRLADVLLAARLRHSVAGPLAGGTASPGAVPRRGDHPTVELGGGGVPRELGAEPVTSFVLHTLGTIDPAAGIGVLAVDEFVEVVPSPGRRRPWRSASTPRGSATSERPPRRSAGARAGLDDRRPGRGGRRDGRPGEDADGGPVECGVGGPVRPHDLPDRRRRREGPRPADQGARHKAAAVKFARWT